MPFGGASCDLDLHSSGISFGNDLGFYIKEADYSLGVDTSLYSPLVPSYDKAAWDERSNWLQDTASYSAVSPDIFLESGLGSRSDLSKL